MSYKQTSIMSIVDRINRSYFIPDIQRNYVWLQNPKAKKIELLFDSLMRGYPIGAFLFWALMKDYIESDFDNDNRGEKLNFQLYKFIERYDVRHPNNEKYYVSQLTNDELNVVLDGQQRLTSLYIGLRGSRCLKRRYARANDPNPYETTYLYLDLLHKPKDDTPEDRYMFEFMTEEEVKEEEGKLWFKVGNITRFPNEDAVVDFCDQKQYNRCATNILVKLYKVVNDPNVISYYEETEKNLDKVLRIFIRVNSGGMQLSYSDLLMSLLTATFKSDIRDQMDIVVERMKDDGFACFGRDQVLKTCLLVSEDCSHVFKIENFSKANIHKIEENWESVVSYLYATTSLLRNLGYKNNLSSGYIIAVICLYLFKKGCQKPSKQDKEAMAKFVRIAQMRSYFTTSLDTKLSTIKEIVYKADNFEYVVKELEKLPEFKVNMDYLEWAVENVEYGSPAVLPLLQLLYPNLDYGSVIFHIDHIYPKSKFNKKTEGLPDKYLKRANELWNLQLLKGEVNESKRDKDPEKWLKAEMTDPDKRKEYFTNNYIPEDFVLEWQDIENFEIQRKQKMLEALMKVFDIQKPKTTNKDNDDCVDESFTEKNVRQETRHRMVEEYMSDDDLYDCSRYADAVIKKYRDNPGEALSEFVQKCESSLRDLKKEGLNND